jgi:hypothetical protein
LAAVAKIFCTLLEAVVQAVVLESEKLLELAVWILQGVLLQKRL